MTNQERAEKIYKAIREYTGYEPISPQDFITSQLDEAQREAKKEAAEMLAAQHSKDFWMQGFAAAREKLARQVESVVDGNSSVDQIFMKIAKSFRAMEPDK